MSCPYIEGQTAVIQATFRDTAGALVDPSAVTVTVEAPDGTITNPTATNISTGIWHAAFAMDQPGWWKWRIVGASDEGDAVCEGKCCARPSIITDTSPSSP